MKFGKIAILTSEKSWFVPYARRLNDVLNAEGYSTNLFLRHEEIGDEFEVVFILSYFKIIPIKFLEHHRYNLVVHESDLPRGRGWAPLFWQILEGQNKIPVVLFAANKQVDGGKVFLKDFVTFEGHELYDEIRKKQGQKTIEMCLRFLADYGKFEELEQKGNPTFYKKRTPKDSELDINKSISEQFNLLRIVSNEEFPAFFYHKGHKYVLNIRKDKGIEDIKEAGL